VPLGEAPLEPRGLGCTAAPPRLDCLIGYSAAPGLPVLTLSTLSVRSFGVRTTSASLRRLAVSCGKAYPSQCLHLCQSH